jgi:hypothetical protein
MKSFALIFFALTAILHAGSVKFEKDLYEAHAGIKDDTVTREFKFTNSSEKPIKIRHADAGCTCVAVEFSGGKATYAAGESGVMRVAFKVENTQGQVDKTVHIWLEGDPDEKPSSQVIFRIHIPTAIKLEPKTLSWDLNSKPETKSIRIIIDYEKQVHLKKISLSNENYTSEIIPVEEGKTYDVRITPKSTATPGLCMIGIETDIDIEKYQRQQGFARISSPAKKP